MKRFLVLIGALLAVAACAPQEAPPPAAAPAPGYAAEGATNYYDGTYTGSFVLGATPAATGQCQNYPVAPALTIRNGVARFAALNIDFEGQVTPQGQLTMQGPSGSTFTGQIDPYFALTGRVTTPNCTYDASWKRYQKRP